MHKFLFASLLFLLSFFALRAGDTLWVQGSMGRLHVVIDRPVPPLGGKGASQQRIPLVIQCHGFAGNIEGPLNRSIAKVLNEKGIASLRFDFNGHGKSEGDFQNMTVPNEIEDAKRIVRFALSLPWVEKVAMLGHSQGGVVTSMTAGEMGDTLQAVVLMAPAAVLRDDAIRGNTFGSIYDPLSPPEYVQLSNGLKLGRNFIKTAFSLPIYETAKLYQGPACMIHGTGDRIVPYTYSIRYRDIWPWAQLHILPGEDHGFMQYLDEAVFHATKFLVGVLSVSKAPEAQSSAKPRNYRSDYHPGYRDWKRMAKGETDAFFSTPEAEEIGDNVLLYQRATGGWPKNHAMHRPLTQAQKDSVRAEKKRIDSTIDNDATITEMIYLARLYQSTHKKRFRDAFDRAVDYIISGQYANGGWPQFWPEPHGYAKHITYNDDAMYNVMRFIQQIVNEDKPFAGIISAKKVKALSACFDKGIECILNTQIVVDGKPTVWCQQHDENTLAPAPARSFELAAYCSSESASLVSLLMSLDHPSQRVIAAVEGAMAWFKEHEIHGIKLETYINLEGRRDRRVVEDAAAPAIWARYYDLEFAQPFFCDRDGVPVHSLEQIGHERRNGYGWYSYGPAEIAEQYKTWKEKH